jgi:stage II sporulation protein D
VKIASTALRGIRSRRAALSLLIALPLGAWQARAQAPGVTGVFTVTATPVPPSARRGGGPIVRVGVAVNLGRVAVSSQGGLRLEDARTGQPAGEVAPAGVLVASVDGDVLHLEGDLPDVPAGVPSIRVHPVQDEWPVIIAGRPYRGWAELRVVGRGRVSAINELPLEDYLLGVVPLEIGPRETAELAAVEAQAIAARTYAVAQLGGQGDAGFDLFGTVDDQAYGGIAAERDESSRAVRRTAGKILLFEGRPIRAYYHSTCGGRTAAIEEVMDREPAPYLQSVLDQAPDGTDYCASSPRYRWTAAWSGAQLDSISRPGLAAVFGVAPQALGPVERLEILDRTPSGRVRDLAFQGPGLDLVVSRLEIRRVLAFDERILNSTDFSITHRDDGLVELNGRGYGHGAGMCQWGAIGRARAGQSHSQILETYYPGAVLVTAYEGEDG